MIREATLWESENLLSGDPGFVAESGGLAVGYVGFNEKVPGVFYGHSLRVTSDAPFIAARLFQAARKHAKSLGYEKVTWGVDPRNSAMVRLVDSGKAVVAHLWVETRV